MPLEDFRRNVGNEVSWYLGGRQGEYVGVVDIVDVTSTNLTIGTYANLRLLTNSGRNPLLGSADYENDFSITHTIRDGKIVLI